MPNTTQSESNLPHYKREGKKGHYTTKTVAQMRQEAAEKWPIDPALKKEMNERKKYAKGPGVRLREKDLKTRADLTALANTKKRVRGHRHNKITGKINDHTWSYEKRVETLTTFLATGVKGVTSELTGVPVSTISAWMKEQWWKELADEIREEKGQEIDAKLTGIIDSALETITDRLTGGDPIYNPRTGETVRIPLKAVDTVRVFKEVFEKRALGRGDPTQRVERVSTEQRLGKLAEQFAQFAGAKEIVVDVNTDEGDS